LSEKQQEELELRVDEAPDELVLVLASAQSGHARSELDERREDDRSGGRSDGHSGVHREDNDDHSDDSDDQREGGNEDEDVQHDENEHRNERRQHHEEHDEGGVSDRDRSDEDGTGNSGHSNERASTQLHCSDWLRSRTSLPWGGSKSGRGQGLVANVTLGR